MNMLDTGHTYQFSICTLVTSRDEYQIMKSSFEEKGFGGDCEYLEVDNSKGNQADAYESIRYFLNRAKGRFVILVHQDVRCQDSREQLTQCIEQLNELDPQWAICGNAGAKGYHQDIMYINTNGRMDVTENLPCQVNSLDENLLIIDANKRLAVSSDIGGFHFYGTDLCLVADLLGYTAYVIPFMVKHLSHGNLQDMALHRPAFIKAYGRKFRSRYIQTTCTKFYLSNGVRKNSICNMVIIFFLIKAWQRLKYNIALLSTGRKHPKTVRYENEIIK